MENFRLNSTYEFNHFSGGSESMYKYIFGIHITEGIKYLADTYECYWLLDLICIHSKDFKVSVEDGNKNVIKEIDVRYSDFRADEVHVWLENMVIYLPNEH
jgi:hypothetical protein